MKKCFLSVILLFGLVVLVSMAAGETISGKWEVNIQTGHGDFSQVMTFEQEGENLKISYESQDGEGTIDDKSLEFSIVLLTPMGDFEAEFTGEVDGTEMSGEVSIAGNPMEWTAKKID